jgi:hypothetical protein
MMAMRQSVPSGMHDRSFAVFLVPHRGRKSIEWRRASREMFRASSETPLPEFTRSKPDRRDRRRSGRLFKNSDGLCRRGIASKMFAR